MVHGGGSNIDGAHPIKKGIIDFTAGSLGKHSLQYTSHHFMVMILFNKNLQVALRWCTSANPWTRSK